MTTVFCAVANSRESASGRGRIDMRVGIIGVGMTAFRPSTPEYSWKELMFEAASRAYADAGVDPRTEVDSFVTCAEDYYEGFGIFDEFTPDQIGGALRPVCTVTGDGLQGLANAFMQLQTGLIDVAVVEPRSDVTRIRYGSAASDGLAIRRPSRRATGRRRRTPNSRPRWPIASRRSDVPRRRSTSPRSTTVSPTRSCNTWRRSGSRRRGKPAARSRRAAMIPAGRCP